MPETYFVQRGNRKYAYRSTSVYEPGSKYPKTVNEYIGVLDEGTETLFRRKTGQRPINSLMMTASLAKG